MKKSEMERLGKYSSNRSILGINLSFCRIVKKENDFLARFKDAISIRIQASVVIYCSLQSVGFLIGNVEFRLEIEYGGRGGGQESQFHSLFFMQAAVVAYNIFKAERH